MTRFRIALTALCALSFFGGITTPAVADNPGDTAVCGHCWKGKA